MEFRKGDIFLSHKIGNPIFNIVKRATTAPGEEETFATHTGIFINAFQVIEADVGGVVITDFFQKYGEKHDLFVFRPDISEKYQNQLAFFARDYLGRKYGFFKIILHASDWILSEITRKEKYFFRKLAKNNNYPICSWLVAHCFKKIGLDFGINPNYCQPDDIYDYCLRNEDLYKLIYKKVSKE